jgi:hypothetical protein
LKYRPNLPLNFLSLSRPKLLQGPMVVMVENEVELTYLWNYKWVCRVSGVGVSV